MLQFGVAKELGLTLGEVRSQMTAEELIGWSAYFQILNEDQEKAMEKAKRRRYPRRLFTAETEVPEVTPRRGLQS